MKEDQIRNLKALLQRLDVVRDKITARKEGKEILISLLADEV